jgi:cytochrome c biogenesis protein CcmG, thiol:disulfide interchange protein DsbE
MHARRLFAAVGLAIALAAPASAPAFAADAPAVRLEGAGPDRQALDALQNKPFDASLWGKLTGYSGGSAPTADSTRGKVVLVVTWASWLRASHAAVKAAGELAADAGDDLVVVAVHHPREFDKAPDTLKTLGFAGLSAHDAQGEFRKALRGRPGPDVYLIDRAGNLRYARLSPTSMPGAVKALLAETPEQAADAARAAESAGSGGGSPVAPGEMPGPEAYAAAKWPKPNTQNLMAGDFQGKPLPKKLGTETYLKGEKPDTTGKIVVIDFWATWCPPCIASMPGLDKLQDKFKDDVVIIGLSDEDAGTVERFMKSDRGKNIKYAKAVDPAGTLKNAMKVQGIPHIAVLSTDGVVRWQGHPMMGLDKAVEDMVASDPGVKARRAASKK